MLEFSEQCLCPKDLKGPGLNDITSFRNATNQKKAGLRAFPESLVSRLSLPNPHPLWMLCCLLQTLSQDG